MNGAGERLLVTGIGELCTCDPARGEPPGVVRDAALVADGGLVTWVGEAAELPHELANDATRTIDVEGACVVPGFVDCHTHLLFGGDRASEFAARAAGATYEAIAASGGGIASTIAATTAESDTELLEAAVARAAAACSRGTTTIEVKTGYGADARGELRLLGLVAELDRRAACAVVPTLLALHGRAANAAAHLTAVLDGLLSAARPDAAFVDVFCDPVAWDVDSCRAVLERAAELGFGLKVHAEQTARSGGAALAAELGATSADHLEHANRADADALARAGVVGVLLPGVTLSLRTAPPDARMLAAAGVELALATDCNPGTSNTSDMRLVVALAVGLLGLTPAEALVASTRGGAAALALADRGVLQPGRRCDLAVLGVDTHVDLAYRLGDVPVSQVVAAGHRVA